MTTLSADARLMGVATVPERWDADEAVVQLYTTHYRPLVRLASLLVRHSGEAEEIVQDAFVAMHDKWRKLKEPERAAGYLRTTVVNKARSAQRRHVVADKHTPRSLPHAASAEHDVLAGETRSSVIAALNQLPQRQREVLVLRYYLDLSEADIAATLGISRGSVKSHASRGMSAIRSTLEDQS